MITFHQVSHCYARADQPAVKDVNFELKPGEFYFLTGPSGAGKTTLFRMMHMDLKPTSGVISLFGKNIARLSRDEIAHTRRRMGVVFQDYRLLNHLTVRENVALPLSLHGRLSPEQDKCVDEILEWVGLGDKLSKAPETLSGGEKQRVAIARAVVNRPRILVADEPTGNIDDAMARRIMHLFTELNKHGTTVVLATHDQALVKSYRYPCLHIQNGRLIRSAAA